MAKISSRSMFHFTSKDGFVGILKSCFYPRYSKEGLPLANGKFWNYWIPMVSFCDIPLHLVSDHIVEYGKYGIGLNRDWVIKSKLNPVLYYEKSSELFRIWDQLMTQLEEDNRNLEEQSILVDSLFNFYLQNRYIFQYFKPYIGHDYKIDKEKVFYNEREWRYVPPLNLPIDLIRDDDDEFIANKEEENEKLEAYGLSFSPSDINYILIAEESERYDVIQQIRRIKDKFSYKEVECLVSKIITTEQIENDL